MLPLQEHSLEAQLLHHVPLPHTIQIHPKPKTLRGLITEGNSILDLSVIRGINFDVIGEVKRLPTDVGTPSNECFDLILGRLDWTIEVLFAQIIFPPDVTDSDYISQIYIIVYSQLL